MWWDLQGFLAFLSLGSGSAPNDQARVRPCPEWLLGTAQPARRQANNVGQSARLFAWENGGANSNPEQDVKRPPGAKRPSGQGAVKGS